MNQSPNLQMTDGRSIPQLGFGIWQISQNDTAEAVSNAIQMGYRLIDGAYIYGNEHQMGEGIKQSGVPRDDIFLTSKVWNDSHGHAKSRQSVERSLKDIGVEQLDLVLIHWPVPSRNLYVETWQSLIEMRDEGLVKSIGVSNFNAEHLDKIIKETGEKPALNQIEINPELQQPELLSKCRELGVLAQAWTPLGNGRSFDKPTIADVANKHGKSAAQIIMRWHVQSGYALLSRSIKPERQNENLDIFNFELSSTEMDTIAALDVGLRTGPDPSVFKM